MRIRVVVAAGVIVAVCAVIPPVSCPAGANPLGILRGALRQPLRAPLQVVWQVPARCPPGDPDRYPDIVIRRATTAHIDWRIVYTWRHGRYRRQTAQRLYHLGHILCGTRVQCNRAAGLAARAGDLRWALALWRITGHRPAI